MTVNLLAAYPRAMDEPDSFNWGGPFLYLTPPTPHPHRSSHSLRLVTFPRTVTVGEGWGHGENKIFPQNRDKEKKCNTSTFSTAPFIIIQKLVFNAMSSSNHVKVCMIQIVS